MRQNNYTPPVSDPEAEGLPTYADADAVADERRATGRSADGPDPAALPSDMPMAVDRFGTTAEEQRQGEPLDYKLAREQPDPTARPRTGPGDDEGDALSEDLDNLHGDASIAPVQPNRDSPVSMYDIPDELASDRGAPVGRLVEPDEGVREDIDKDMIAFDTGEAGGGPTAEEAAMHEVRER